ncbi:hypothetical protein [Pantoea phage Nifs112]|nr:hypothetical protein [Pantoea phage Nifs112]
MKYRIRKTGESYYPEYRYLLWPFWLAIKESYTCDDFAVCCATQEGAMLHIDADKRSRRLIETTYIKVD